MAKHDAAPPDLVGAPSFGAVEAILNGNLGDHLAREAAAIVLDAQKSRRDAAADRFNRLAKTVPIKLSLTSSRMGVLVPALSLGDTYAGVVALHLWRVLGVGAVDRIKRCRACRRWFADRSRNRSKKQCDADCASRWWNRGRRRRARQPSATFTRRSNRRHSGPLPSSERKNGRSR